MQQRRELSCATWWRQDETAAIVFVKQKIPQTKQTKFKWLYHNDWRSVDNGIIDKSDSSDPCVK